MKGERSNSREIEGKQALFAVNLAPRKMAGLASEAMLFDIGYVDGITPVLAVPETPVRDGTRGGMMLTEAMPTPADAGGTWVIAITARFRWCSHTGLLVSTQPYLSNLFLSGDARCGDGGRVPQGVFREDHRPLSPCTGHAAENLFWVPMRGGRWRIDWQRTNRSGKTNAASV
jgi:tRNA-binding EMAP/Myf-like protein